MSPSPLYYFTTIRDDSYRRATPWTGLVLIDFGLARRFPLPAPLRERNPPGSPTFIAPEVRAACGDG